MHNRVWPDNVLAYSIVHLTVKNVVASPNIFRTPKMHKTNDNISPRSSYLYEGKIKVDEIKELKKGDILTL